MPVKSLGATGTCVNNNYVGTILNIAGILFNTGLVGCTYRHYTEQVIYSQQYLVLHYTKRHFKSPRPPYYTPETVLALSSFMVSLKASLSHEKLISSKAKPVKLPRDAETEYAGLSQPLFCCWRKPPKEPEKQKIK